MVIETSDLLLMTSSAFTEIVHEFLNDFTYISTKKDGFRFRILRLSMIRVVVKFLTFENNSDLSNANIVCHFFGENVIKDPRSPLM